MQQITIELKNASIGYSSRRTSRSNNHDGDSSNAPLHTINGYFHEAEFVSLIGRNGCGKSTLLRSLAGMQPLLSGQILYKNKPLLDYSLRERARLISTVTPGTTPDPSMSVYDLVALGRSPYTGFWGKLSSDDKEIIAASIHAVGMDDYTHRIASTLSDGERQKVLIAKTIAQQTPVILLDEPTSFLDYPSKVSTMKQLRELAHTHHKTIILSTHDLEQAVHFSDTIWLLDRHLGLTTGTPQQLISQDLLANRLGYAYE